VARATSAFAGLAGWTASNWFEWRLGVGPPSELPSELGCPLGSSCVWELPLGVQKGGGRVKI